MSKVKCQFELVDGRFVSFQNARGAETFVVCSSSSMSRSEATQLHDWLGRQLGLVSSTPTHPLTASKSREL